MIVSPSGALVWRDFETDGVPSSGKHKPKKSYIRQWSQNIETLLGSVSSAAAIFSNRASLFAALAYAANTLAWVVADGNPAYNGIYMKSGASGSGAWTRLADLPYSFVRMSNVGAGTVNAIQVTSSIPTSDSILRIANVFAPNTGNVTVSENGAVAKPLLTNSGNQIAPGGLTVGAIIAYVDSGSSFRLLSDQASAAVLAAAESLLGDMQDELAGAVTSLTASTQALRDEAQAAATEAQMYADMVGAVVYDFSVDSDPLTPGYDWSI